MLLRKLLLQGRRRVRLLWRLLRGCVLQRNRNGSINCESGLLLWSGLQVRELRMHLREQRRLQLQEMLLQRWRLLRV